MFSSIFKRKGKKEKREALCKGSYCFKLSEMPVYNEVRIIVRYDVKVSVCGDSNPIPINSEFIYEVTYSEKNAYQIIYDILNSTATKEKLLREMKSSIADELKNHYENEKADKVEKMLKDSNSFYIDSSFEFDKI